MSLAVNAHEVHDMRTVQPRSFKTTTDAKSLVAKVRHASAESNVALSCQSVHVCVLAVRLDFCEEGAEVIKTHPGIQTEF